MYIVNHHKYSAPLSCFRSRSIALPCPHVYVHGINRFLPSILTLPIQIDQIRKDVSLDVEPCSGSGVGALLLCARRHVAGRGAVESTHVAHAAQSGIRYGPTVAHTPGGATRVGAIVAASTHLPQEE